MICAECAEALGFGPAPPSPAAGVSGGDAAKGAGEPAGEPAEVPGPDPGRRCPACGLTAAEFQQQSLFGCPCCYDAFGEDLDPLLKRLHGALAHRGRLPRGRSPEPEPGGLRRQLDEAIRTGDFARAARLRDRLRGPARERPGDGGGAPFGGPS
jgi:protein arginine kinase activator